MNIDIFDAEHPYRRAAIEIIESIVEVEAGHAIDGEAYYTMEDNIVEIILYKLDGKKYKDLEDKAEPIHDVSRKWWTV